MPDGKDVKRKRLHALLKSQSFVFGDFTLTSGAKSSYYFDGKMITLSAEGAYLVACLVADIAAQSAADAIGGPIIGADPIVGAVAAVSFEKGNPIKAFMVRKEPKKHGKKKWIEGPLKEGDKVIIIDDVITTGGSIIDAIKKVEEFGCSVVKIVALVDRLEGGRENLEKDGYELESLFRADEFM
jgi:orotate phosphoribosyltransferase